MTFQGPFKAVTTGLNIEKSNKMYPDLPNFSGATPYTYVLLWPIYEKNMWKVWKYLLLSSLLAM